MKDLVTLEGHSQARDPVFSVPTKSQLELFVRYDSNGRISRLRSSNSTTGLAQENVNTMVRKEGFTTNPDRFQIMDQPCFWVNSSRFTYLLHRCAESNALKEGRGIHANMIKLGIEDDVFLGNNLINMYCKCGSLKDAHKIFDSISERSVLLWNMMISGNVQQGYGKEALKLFEQMQQSKTMPDEFTFGSILKACAQLADLDQGKKVHNHIIKTGFASDIFVGSVLLDMYLKCGCIENARCVFNKMSVRDVVLWTGMIAGYSQNEDSEEAVKLFCEMQHTGVKPNHYTFTSVLRACASEAAIEQGRQCHCYIIKDGLEEHVFVSSALVDMYSKCGSIENAWNMFDKMQQRDVVSWSAMILGYAMHGCSQEALQLFENMQQFGTKPDHVTFIGVLSACCHAGLVDKGWECFDSMSSYGIAPTMEHYGCMVDLLGRAGQLYKARDFINDMPLKPDAAVWGCLLGACRIHANIELGEHVAKHLFELDPKNAAPYVLLSNMYATVGRWNDISKVRKMMKDRGVKKKPGCSWIEIDKRIYAFVVGEKTSATSGEYS